jgi:hypothetical protein
MKTNSSSTKTRRPEFTLNGRAVCDIVIEHGRSRDVVDSFIAKATWEDTGEELTDNELEALQEENGDAFTLKALEDGAWH